VLRLERPAEDARRHLPRLAAAGVTCLGAQPYLDLLSLQSAAGAIVTDLGAVQEQASVLGVPCFTLGATSAHTATLTHGTNVLLGDEPSSIGGVQLVSAEREPCAIARWDGSAAQRAADVLAAHYVMDAALGAEA
jgi:UDP-N-acetylglucosamine 2-epimerase (non-hydrolysing)